MMKAAMVKSFIATEYHDGTQRGPFHSRPFGTAVRQQAANLYETLKALMDWFNFRQIREVVVLMQLYFPIQAH